MPKVKAKKLRKALEYVTAHPEEWDQGYWAKRTPCGTACCLAGRVVLQAGHEIDWRPVTRYDWETDSRIETGEWIADDIKPNKKYPDGAAIEYVAEKVLNYDADLYEDSGEDHLADLFEGGNSLRTLWELASELTDGKIQVPLMGELPGDDE